MNIPRPKPREAAIVSPRESVRKRALQLGLKPAGLKLPFQVLLSLSVGATRPMIDLVRAREIPWLYRARPLYAGSLQGSPIGVIWAAPGSPLVTVVMEDLVACGVTRFVGVGTLGAIQPAIQPGDLIIPSAAVRDEGTSYHYLSKNEQARPAKRVLKALVDSCKETSVTYHVGPVWTTDAPYRETRSRIEYFRRRGVLGVDMESSAIFSIGKYRRVGAGCILVAGENLNKSNPLPPFYRDELAESLTNAVKIAAKSVERLIALKNTGSRYS
jgi:uridine phosphorylase